MCVFRVRRQMPDTYDIELENFYSYIPVILMMLQSVCVEECSQSYTYVIMLRAYSHVIIYT